MDTILTISNLNLSFISNRNKEDSLYLFKDLSLEIPLERITALVGGNGAGKTTLFNVISGIQQNDSGIIRFKKKNIGGLSPYLIAQHGIGRLFQGARIFDDLSILNNMKLGTSNLLNEIPFYNLVFSKKDRNIEKQLTEKAESILIDLFGTGNIFLEKRNSAAGELSYGQQRLLAMARLLMGDYSLYLLDEPTAGVHAQFIDQIASAIHHMNSRNNKTVLIIEHNMQFVRQIANYCLYMDNGSIIMRGTPDEVLDSNIVQLANLGG